MGQREIIDIVDESNKKMDLEDIKMAYKLKHGRVVGTLTMSLSKIRRFNLLNYSSKRGTFKTEYIYWSLK